MEDPLPSYFRHFCYLDATKASLKNKKAMPISICIVLIMAMILWPNLVWEETRPSLLVVKLHVNSNQAPRAEFLGALAVLETFSSFSPLSLPTVRMGLVTLEEFQRYFKEWLVTIWFSSDYL